MVSRAPASGHTVKLPIHLYDEAVLAAGFRGRSVGQYVELAVAAQVERDAHKFKLSPFHAAHREAMQNRASAPLAHDVGLLPPPAFR